MESLKKTASCLLSRSTLHLVDKHVRVMTTIEHVITVAKTPEMSLFCNAIAGVALTTSGRVVVVHLADEVVAHYKTLNNKVKSPLVITLTESQNQRIAGVEVRAVRGPTETHQPYAALLDRSYAAHQITAQASVQENQWIEGMSNLCIAGATPSAPSWEDHSR
ncbi:MAG: hypothetical protein [Ixodes ricinus orinovirus-like virus 1]|uniref:Uncharacterized protein n=1 Tax=Ixodes ricinus orinovirus-like virus 1 TaxID=2950736 RepID=A0AAE9LUR3_9MONO|nr:MAG: hypothetical protein [Ixodes ricinus orinovirus-like virus 1]